MFIRPTEGVTQADRAVALDPLSPFASYIRAASFYMAKRYRKAIAQTVRTSELAPTWIYYDAIDAASYREMGDYLRAVAIYRKDQQYSNKPLFGLGVTYARMGLRDSALRVAHDLETLSKTQYVTPTLIAMIYANLPLPADRDLAFRWIRAGYNMHRGINLALNTAPEFDPLRKDPRFVAILREINERTRDKP